MVYPALLPLMPHTSAVSSRLNWRPPADLNGLANAVGSQYSSHYLGTWCIQHYYRWCRTPRLPAVDWTDAHRADLNGLVGFARKNKSGFFARVSSHFNWPLQHTTLPWNKCPRPLRDSNPQSQQASGGTPTSQDRAATVIGFTFDSLYKTFLSFSGHDFLPEKCINACWSSYFTCDVFKAMQMERSFYWTAK